MHSVQEIYAADEEDVIADIVQCLRQKMVEENPTGLMRRDTHSKMYGVVKAEFIVEPHLPAELAIGIFRQVQTFQAWIRFSNQDTSNKPDIARDIRGMAIKLMQVRHKKLIDSEKAMAPEEPNQPHYCLTHDFILINPPMFIAKNPSQFNGMLKAMAGSLWHKLIFFSGHPRLVWNLITSMVSIANPLQTRYHSTVPYLLGRRAVKYAAIPIVTAPDLLPMEPEDNYLRAVMQTQLTRGDAYFDFCVQIQTNEEDMPIENPQITWSEKEAPFKKVATIRILKQDFDDAAHDHFGENLSFNPWRALPEHRPLGGINRARRAVYQALTQFRHAANQEPPTEPDSWDLPTSEKE